MAGRPGVGNAVNETVVYTFVALFAINIVATAVSVTGDPVSVAPALPRGSPADPREQRMGRRLEPHRHADAVLRQDPEVHRRRVRCITDVELVRLIAQMGLGTGALAVIGGTVVIVAFLTMTTGALVAVHRATTSSPRSVWRH